MKKWLLLSSSAILSFATLGAYASNPRECGVKCGGPACKTPAVFAACKVLCLPNSPIFTACQTAAGAAAPIVVASNTPPVVAPAPPRTPTSPERPPETPVTTAGTGRTESGGTGGAGTGGAGAGGAGAGGAGAGGAGAGGAGAGGAGAGGAGAGGGDERAHLLQTIEILRREIAQLRSQGPRGPTAPGQLAQRTPAQISADIDTLAAELATTTDPQRMNDINAALIRLQDELDRTRGPELARERLARERQEAGAQNLILRQQRDQQNAALDLAAYTALIATPVAANESQWLTLIRAGVPAAGTSQLETALTNETQRLKMIANINTLSVEEAEATRHLMGQIIQRTETRQLAPGENRARILQWMQDIAFKLTDRINSAGGAGGAAAPAFVAGFVRPAPTAEDQQARQDIAADWNNYDQGTKNRLTGMKSSTPLLKLAYESDAELGRFFLSINNNKLNDYLTVTNLSIKELKAARAALSLIQTDLSQRRFENIINIINNKITSIEQGTSRAPDRNYLPGTVPVGGPPVPVGGPPAPAGGPPAPAGGPPAPAGGGTAAPRGSASVIAQIGGISTTLLAPPYSLNQIESAKLAEEIVKRMNDLAENQDTAMEIIPIYQELRAIYGLPPGGGTPNLPLLNPVLKPAAAAKLASKIITRITGGATKQQASAAEGYPLP